MEQLTRVDKQRLMKEGEPTIDPEIYEPPLKLPPKRRGGVDVNEVMAKTLEDDGVASRVYGQLFDNKRPEVAGQSLSRVMGNKLDNKRLGIIIEAVLLGMGDASKPIVREVCPRGKKERRRDSRPTASAVGLVSGNRATVADRVIARLEPELKVKLVDHPIGDLIYVLQAPVRDRIRRMVREQGSNF